MKVLSLFDGISCGMVALERLGHKITSEKGTSANRFGKVHFNIYKLEEAE